MYWQVLDKRGWGLVECDEDRPSGPAILGTVNMKYFVLAHYSRHIRPGMTIGASSGVGEQFTTFLLTSTMS